ncbi:la-related protein 7 [Platysternon megacephalum]|uniref:La-related protein 7 n=1 Tax=Platysternon megacephalum TaxID=55544 RepID=A0A4D9E076_9SAUR|nr:la-related protein 7 [Platysternon megacephalum]
MHKKGQVMIALMGNQGGGKIAQISILPQPIAPLYRGQTACLGTLLHARVTGCPSLLSRALPPSPLTTPRSTDSTSPWNGEKVQPSCYPTTIRWSLQPQPKHRQPTVCYPAVEISEVNYIGKSQSSDSGEVPIEVDMNFA